MKKILFLSLLLVSLASYGQAKNNPTFQKGMKKVYVTELTGKGEDSIVAHMSIEQQYEVVDETPDGYVLDIQVNNIQANEKTPRGLSLSTTLMITEGKHCQYLTDKNGKLLRSLSKDEVEEKYRKNYFSVDELTPSENDTIDKEMIQKLKAKDFESLQGAISPLCLNGKNIVDGKEEKLHKASAFKMKRTFHVNADGNIQSHAGLDVKPEEIREFFVKKFKQMGIGMSDEALEDIEDLVRNFNLNYSEDASYTFLPDGWVKTIDCTVTTQGYEQSTLSLTYKVYVK
ncbi:MAG: hypothetical protein J6P55_00780 [Bacteroidaceae bacterium]|nr:hypothetical protein [Bacteroidaceae bacterium]